MHGLSRAKIETTETQLFLLYYSANCSFSFAQVPFYHCLRCQQPEVFRSKMEDASVLLLEPNQMDHSQNSEILGLLFIILPLSPPSLPLSPSLSLPICSAHAFVSVSEKICTASFVVESIHCQCTPSIFSGGTQAVVPPRHCPCSPFGRTLTCPCCFRSNSYIGMEFSERCSSLAR